MYSFNSLLILVVLVVISSSFAAADDALTDEMKSNNLNYYANKEQWANFNIRDYISDKELSHYELLHTNDVNRIKTVNAIRQHFSKEEILSFAETKRIRREIRDISYSQWMKIADAMNVMKFTGQEVGLRKYGSKFLNLDYMTCFHAQAAWQSIGNQNHFSPSFVTWHRAFELMFEESLIAIDDTIEAVPYWDFRRDILDPLHSVIFSDKYLGELMGDTDRQYGIKDGPFAYWPIGIASESGPECDKVSNIFGQMRNPVLSERSPYVTRMGSAMCGMHNNFIGTLSEWDECLNKTLYTEMNDFQDCWENTFHYAAHAFVGGTRNPNITQGGVYISNETWDFFSYEDTKCYTWSASAEVESIDDKAKIYKFYAHPVNDCFDCHKECSTDDFSLQCKSCHLIDSECVIMEGELDGSDAVASGFSLNDENTEYVWGDMLDAITSPNDPFFMFHHINLDRYVYIWELLNYESNDEYYYYPESGWAQGINLDDIACYEHPLKGIFDMFDEDKPLTHRNIFDATTFADSPYMYDDILEGLMASIENEEKALGSRLFGFRYNYGNDINNLVYLCVVLVVVTILMAVVKDMCKNKRLKDSSANTDISTHYGSV